MTVYPDGRLECTPADLLAYHLLLQRQAQQNQTESDQVMAIVGVTPALRFHITEAIARYQKSMFSY